MEFALAVWRGLMEASPHGCRVHLTGGEPFGDWPRLLELCRLAGQQGLGPPEKIETNAFWATDRQVIRRRLAALNEVGMGKLVISADPYHQQFVPIEQCRLTVRLAEELLGADRVQVRWRDWLADGFDTAALTDAERAVLFARTAAAGRERFNGRAAELLAETLPCKPPADFADSPCRDALLRSRHVHVDDAGRIMPGTCAGILVGLAGDGCINHVWRRLGDDYAERPILGTLADCGPVGLLAKAQAAGFVARAGYAGKCHLCWDIRRFLVRKGAGGQELGPDWLYGA